MNLTELLIIYLACGAPFAMYYFFQNRNRLERGALVLQTTVRFLLWIAFALPLVARRTFVTRLFKLGFDGRVDLDSKRENEIQELRKSFESLFSSRKTGVSVFEFREIYDRFTGLTGELAIKPGNETGTNFEIFRISGHTNGSLGTRCLKRRNRLLLEYHQKLACYDFLELVSSHFGLAAKQLIVRLAEVLDDKMIESSYAGIIEGKNRVQRIHVTDVSSAENNLWKAGKPRQLQEQMTSANIRLMRAKQSLSGND